MHHTNEPTEAEAAAERAEHVVFELLEVAASFLDEGHGCCAAQVMADADAVELLAAYVRAGERERRAAA